MRRRVSSRISRWGSNLLGYLDSVEMLRLLASFVALNGMKYEKGASQYINTRTDIWSRILLFASEGRCAISTGEGRNGAGCRKGLPEVFENEGHGREKRECCQNDMENCRSAFAEGQMGEDDGGGGKEMGRRLLNGGLYPSRT